MPGLLDEKICLITGAGTGIGAGAAEAFAREGARLVLVGRTKETLERTAEQIRGLGADVLCVVSDVSRADDARRMVAESVEEFGRLDCAFNNAGVDGVQAPTADYPQDVWDEVLSINLTGVWNSMRFEIQQMQDQGGGAIVNVSSATAEPMQPMMSAYVASKYGVNGLTKTAAFEYAKENIRINALALGVIATPMVAALMEEHEAIREGTLREQPIGRLGAVEECGEAAAWMLSEQNSFMIGSNVLVDGGYALPRRMF